MTFTRNDTMNRLMIKGVIMKMFDVVVVLVVGVGEDNFQIGDGDSTDRILEYVGLEMVMRRK
jgi:hypothetical protein